MSGVTRKDEQEQDRESHCFRHAIFGSPHRALPPAAGAPEKERAAQHSSHIY
jgi:hypothetical protein